MLTDHPTDQLAPGVVVAGYRVEEELAPGPLGRRFGARVVHTGRRVALELLPGRLAADDRLVDEIRASAACEHPNVLGILELVPMDDEGLLVVGEWTDSEPLPTWIKRRTPVAAHLAASVAAQAALGLEEARGQGLTSRPSRLAGFVVHRDRVLLTPLSAGGYATPRWESHDPWLAGAERRAPEVADGDEADERTDVYALGCLLTELLGGAGRDDEEAAEAPTGPALALEGVARQATADDPDRRHPTLRAFAVATLRAGGVTRARTAPAPGRRLAARAPVPPRDAPAPARRTSGAAPGRAGDAPAPGRLTPVATPVPAGGEAASERRTAVATPVPAGGVRRRAGAAVAPGARVSGASEPATSRVARRRALVLVPTGAALAAAAAFAVAGLGGGAAEPSDSQPVRQTAAASTTTTTAATPTAESAAVQPVPDVPSEASKRVARARAARVRQQRAAARPAASRRPARRGERRRAPRRRAAGPPGPPRRPSRLR